MFFGAGSASVKLLFPNFYASRLVMQCFVSRSLGNLFPVQASCNRSRGKAHSSLVSLHLRHAYGLTHKLWVEEWVPDVMRWESAKGAHTNPDIAIISAHRSTCQVILQFTFDSLPAVN